MIFIDPTGAIIEDSDGIVRNYRGAILKQIDGLEILLETKGLDFSALGTAKEAVEQLQGELQGVVGELNSLQNSDQVYKVSYSSEMSSGEGGISFDKSDNSVQVQVGKGTGFGVVGHELLHAYQFESGQISISYDNSEYGSLYDISDETAGYRREHLVEQGVAGIQSRKVITNEWTYSLGEGMTPPAYRGLPNKNISILSPQGLALIVNNNLRKRMYPVRYLPKEVYKGWNK